MPKLKEQLLRLIKFLYCIQVGKGTILANLHTLCHNFSTETTISNIHHIDDHRNPTSDSILTGNASGVDQGKESWATCDGHTLSMIISIKCQPYKCGLK